MNTVLGSLQGGGSRKPRLPRPAALGMWPVLAVLLVIFVWPTVVIISRSVTDPPGAGLSNFHRVLTDPTVLRFGWNTVRTALIVTAATAVIGYGYAYAIYRAGPALRVLLLFCALLPFWTSLLVRSFAWTVILRDTGIVNWLLLRVDVVDHPVGLLRTPFAVTLGMTQILLPFVILPCYTAMMRFDRDLHLAARSLGARPSAAFWLVFFPVTRVGLVAGSILVLVLSLGYYITPVLLGGPGDQPIAVLIASQVTTQLDWGLAGSMAAVVTAVVLALLALGWRLVARAFLGEEVR
ncbi:MAG: binding-protein-dependent transport system inner rane component [Frankiales bacterium]|jgi:putative spermidine/putrescine transport system permease protein|nr:binding-protein-dependent transport system inner rane component [Frankiales bacterium]